MRAYQKIDDIIYRPTRKILSLILCGALFFGSSIPLTFARVSPKASQVNGSEERAALIRVLESFYASFAVDLENPVRQKLKGFLPRWYRWERGSSQDYSDIVIKLRKEAKALEKAMVQGHDLQKRVQRYINCEGKRSCVSAPIDRNDVLERFIDRVYLPLRRLALILMDHVLEGKREEGEGSYLALVDKLIDFPISKDVFDYDPGATRAFEENLGAVLLSDHSRPGEEESPLPLVRALKVVPMGTRAYRLEHDPWMKWKRDVSMILFAPVPMTYIRALKWSAMENLVLQIEGSQQHLRQMDPISIPRSCQTEENGFLPSQIPMREKASPLASFLDHYSLLIEHGVFTASIEEKLYPLLFDEFSFSGRDRESPLVVPEDEKTSKALDRFLMAQELLENHIDYLVHVPVNMSIERGDMYGILPFEQVEKADFALRDQYEKEEEPYFDDLKSFDVVYPYLLQMALAKLEAMKKRPPYGKGKISSLPPTEKMAELYDLFQKSVTFWSPPIPSISQNPKASTPERAWVHEDVWNIPIDSEKDEWFNVRGFTRWQVELMLKHKSSDLMSFLSKQVESEMRSNRIEYEFPPYYSSANMKRLALEELLEGLRRLRQDSKEREDEGKEEFFDVFRQLVRDFGRPKATRSELNSWDYLKKNGGPFLDDLISHIDPYSSDFQFSGLPAKSISDKRLKNVWPTLKKIYDILQEKGVIEQKEISEYDYIEEQIYGRMYREENPWAVLKLSYYLLKSQIERKVFYRDRNGTRVLPMTLYRNFILPLGLDLPFGPFFAQRVLRSKKGRMAAWSLIQATLDAQNGFLLRTSSKMNPGNRYYDLLKGVAVRPIVTKEQFDRTSRHLFKRAADLDWAHYRQKSDRYFDHPLFESADDLYEIYKTDDIDLKEQRMISFIQRYDIGDRYSAQRHFLKADFYSKNLIYRELIRQAVMDQKENLEKKLEEVCLMEHDEVENYKRTYYSLSTEQSVLKEKYGMDELPKSVEKRLHSLSSRDVKVLQHNMVMFPLLLLGSGLGMAGCGATFGLGCVAAYGGISALLGNESYWVLHHSFNQYYESKAMEAKMNGFKEIGFTDDQSIKEFHRGPGWMVAEGVLLFPLVGIFSRVATTSGKAFLEVGKSALKGQRPMGNVLAHSHEFSILRESKYVLGFSSLGSDLKSAGQGLRRGVGFLGKRGKDAPLGHSRMGPFHHIDDLPGKGELDQKLAQSFERQFKGDLRKMRSFLFRYQKGGKGSSVFKDVLRRHQKILGQKGNSKLTGKWAQMRAKRMEKLIDRHENLEILLERIGESIKRGDSITVFVQSNLDELSILKNLPMKMREFPHLISFQGGGTVRGRIPLYEGLIEGAMVKRMMRAYDNLLGEYVRREAVELLTGSKARMIHSSYQFIDETFQQIYRQVDGGRMGTDVGEQLLKYQEGLLDKISMPLKLKIKHPELADKKRLLEILFYSSDAKERGLAKAIWNSNDLGKLVQDEKLKKFAKNAFRELNQVKGERGRNLKDLDLSFRLIRIIGASSRPEMLF
ncbi:MAG: hypothetical protein OXB88_10210 [Bacteriovoracales bacterium]|nr:hypothetical protein [Bacteriovoracales bacterium]